MLAAMKILFVLLGLLLSLGLEGLGALTNQLRLVAGSPERAVGVESLHLVGDGAEGDGRGGLGCSNNLTLELSGGGDILGRGVSLLDATLAGEHNQASFIFLQALGVELERLGALILTSVIYGNANGPGQGLGDARLLKLLQGETTSGSLLEVIFLGGALHKGSQVTSGGAGGILGGFNASLLPADLLLDRLVEPGLHPGVPVLVEVLVGDNVVMSDHFLMLI
mmetsp:Transcript_12633/g.27413  ORF Transcript_12633/g.27413 Transcript_12633/m.27413 type:complete len:223 (-) Transcript_12633:7-675(-)